MADHTPGQEEALRVLDAESMATVRRVMTSRTKPPHWPLRLFEAAMAARGFLGRAEIARPHDKAVYMLVKHYVDTPQEASRG